MSSMFKRKKRKDLGIWARTRQDVRCRLLSGLLVIVPLGITVLVVRFLYGITAGNLKPVILRMAGELPVYMVTAISVFLFLAGLYMIGLVATAMLGRRLISLGEAIIQRIPFVKSIYGASKQLVEAVSGQDNPTGFQAAVFVRFPHPDMLAIGFMTGVIEVDGETYCKLFIPTTPNPTTGFYEMVKPQHVYQTHMSVEEATKMLMSAGLVMPETPLNLTPIELPLVKNEVPSLAPVSDTPRVEAVDGA